MTDALDTMGPIDYLVVEFPGSRMTGEGLPLLVDLVDRGIIRILDLVFIRKELDGSVAGIEIADFDADGTLDLAVFEGHPPACSAPTRSRKPGRSSNRAAPPASSCTRTSGPRRWPSRCAGAAANWSPVDGSPSRRRWPRWTPPKPTPDHQPAGEEDTVMPGLLRGIARTAAVAGTATAVSNRVSRRQGGRWAAKEQQQQQQQQPAPQQQYAQPPPQYAPQPQYAPPPPPAAPAPAADTMSDKLAQLKDLGELKSAGVLTEAEFEAQKQRILG